MLEGHPMQTATALEILLVDDDEQEAELLEVALQDAGSPHRLHWVSSGPEALAWLRSHPQPDLILLDINMPVMDGHETLQAIRADPDLWHLHVAVLTTSSSERDMDLSFQAHADAFITKPRGMDDLPELVSRIDALADAVILEP